MKLSLLTACFVATFGGQALSAAKPVPVQVMVLGTWHFDNPGLDLNNVTSDDVLKPARQAELAAVADAIAAFRPTKVMVERVVTDPALVDPVYAEFEPTMLAAQRDERVQVAYRIARRTGLDRVYASDEQPSHGEPDYFPVDAVMKYAQSHAMADRLNGMMEVPAAELKKFEALQSTHSMGQLLAFANDPKSFMGSIAGYYGLLAVGDTAQQPGADLNAMWYLRNAKIFAKLVTKVGPGDRVLVVYGAGHNYWLRHFASETPGFANIDPVPYLTRAKALPARPIRRQAGRAPTR